MSHTPEGRAWGDQGSYTELAPEWAETSWFRFPRDFIRDQRLSWESRAVAAWMASHDPSFRFDVAYVVKAGPAGRDKVRRIMNELETAGYLVRRRTRNGDGSFGPIIYRLHPEPQSTIGRSEPAPENPSMDTVSKMRNRRSAPAPEKPATADPATAAQEGYKKTDLQEEDLSIDAREDGPTDGPTSLEPKDTQAAPEWALSLVLGLDYGPTHKRPSRKQAQELAGLVAAARDVHGLSEAEIIRHCRLTLREATSNAVAYLRNGLVDHLPEPAPRAEGLAEQDAPEPLPPPKLVVSSDDITADEWLARGLKGKFIPTRLRSVAPKSQESA